MLKEKMRNSNIEILRIISMIFIVLSHYSVHGGVIKNALPLCFNQILLNIIVLGNIGVIIFVLITGYFLIDSDNFSLKKILKIILQVWFYSVIIYVISCIFGLTEFSKYEFLVNFLPIISKRYGFVTCYVVIYIFHPFINKFLKCLTKKDYNLFLIISLIIFSIIPTFVSIADIFYGNEIIQFILFYSIGAYLKKYGIPKLTEKRNKYVLIISSVILIVSVIIIDVINVKNPGIGMYVNHFYERYSIVAIIFSISLFMRFTYRKQFYNSAINLISATMFGIYLIHDNNYIRSFLWQNILRCKEHVMSNFLILHIILSVLLVFVICIIIELIRKHIIENLFFKKFDNSIDKLQNIIFKITNYM